MAIDNAEKRRSASQTTLCFLGAGVTPNVAKDVEWRQQSCFGYSGILVGVLEEAWKEIIESVVYIKRNLTDSGYIKREYSDNGYIDQQLTDDVYIGTKLTDTVEL